MIPFRLYYLTGCQHCEKAISFLTERQVPFQRVDISNDPIASKGIQAALETEIVPVMVAFHSKEIVKGFKPTDYARLITSYRSAGKSNVDNRAEQNPLPNTLEEAQ